MYVRTYYLRRKCDNLKLLVDIRNFTHGIFPSLLASSSSKPRENARVSGSRVSFCVLLSNEFSRLIQINFLYYYYFIFILFIYFFIRYFVNRALLTPAVTSKFLLFSLGSSVVFSELLTKVFSNLTIKNCPFEEDLSGVKLTRSRNKDISLLGPAI